jgi:hypothetical protein
MTNFENYLEFVDNIHEAGLLWKDEKFKVGNNCSELLENVFRN